MLSPTASIASSSALTPTYSWKSLSPTSGISAPSAPAIARRGHQPTRPPTRSTVPRQPVAASRRSAERATHSSTPTGIRSYLLQRRAPQQALGPHEHDRDQDGEHDQVGVGRRDVPGGEGLGEPDQQPAEH